MSNNTQIEIIARGIARALNLNPDDQLVRNPVSAAQKKYRVWHEFKSDARKIYKKLQSTKL